MKRLVGGDYLLDLTPIEIEESVDGETYTNITNAEVLEQLTNLKKFISNPEMIKPVWVKLFNGETDELIVVRGQFKVVDSDEFEIDVQLDGYHLKIHIEFTQATLSDSTPIDDWYIDTNDAKYLFTSDTQALSKELSDFTGDVKVTGDVEVTGNAKLFENIVDANGHKRFIDGNGIVNSELTGLTSVFCKWSLSGTHIMFVLAGTFADESEISNAQMIVEFNLPEWIQNKIYGVWGSNIELKTYNMYANDWTSQTLDVILVKQTGGVRLQSAVNRTMTADRNFRFAFDLIIDNE